MGFLSKLKAVLGLSDSGRRSGRGTSVTVEREPETASERAVKEGGPRRVPEADDTAEGDAAGDADGRGDSGDVEVDAEDDATGDAEGDAAGDADAGDADADSAEDADEGDGTAEGSAGPDAGRGAPDVEDGDESVETIKGIGPAYAERLDGAGVVTVADLAAADAGELAEATGISASRIETWIERTREG